MSLTEVLIALCLIGKSLQIVKFSEDDTALTNQLGCVKTALRTFLINRGNIGIFFTNSSSPPNSLLKVVSVVFTQWDSVPEEFFSNIRAIVIFLEGNPEKDLSALNRLRNIDIDIFSPVLIVCIADGVCSSDMYMQKIAEEVENPELHYVAVDHRGIIHIYEYTERAEGRCGMPQLLRLGRCSDRSNTKKIFEKLINFHGCPIRVATWTFPPYSVPCSSDHQSNQLCGLSGNVVHAVTHYLNATPVLLTLGTPQDLGVGELDARLFPGVSYTGSYMIIQAALVAPHSTWSLGQSFGNIAQPLEDEVWLAIGVVMALIFILRRLVPGFRKIGSLQHFGMFLGVTVPRQPRRLPTRIYFCSLVFFGYVCSQSYLANLIEVLTTPEQLMIRTLADLEKSNLRVTGTASQREKFEAEYPRIYKDFQVIEDSSYYRNVYRLLEKNSDSIYYLEDMDRNIAQWRTLAALQDEFNWFPIVLAVPNTSAILSASSDILMSIFESGIMNAPISLISPVDYVPKYHDPAPSERSAKLKLRELKYVFLVLGTGLSMSVLVFLIEIMIACIRKKQKFHRGNGTDLSWSWQRRFHGIQISRQTSSMRTN